jgi:hypothetical protein
MGISIVIAALVGVGIVSAFLAMLAFVAWLRAKCPRCGGHRLKQIDYHVFYDPAPEWSLYRCRDCHADFIRSQWRYTCREEWRGDPEAEQMFAELEHDLNTAKLELAKSIIRKTSVGIGAFGIIDSSDFFPPRPILNDFLSTGYDACAQDGMDRWEPFEVSSDHFDALKSWWLETHPKATEDSLGATSWTDWLAKVLDVVREIRTVARGTATHRVLDQESKRESKPLRS